MTTRLLVLSGDFEGSGSAMFAGVRQYGDHRLQIPVGDAGDTARRVYADNLQVGRTPATISAEESALRVLMPGR